MILDVVNLFPLPSDMILSSTSRGRWRSTDEERVVLLVPGCLPPIKFQQHPTWQLPSASLYAASQNLSGFLVSFISPPTQHSSASIPTCQPFRGQHLSKLWSRLLFKSCSRRACELVIQYIRKIVRWFFFPRKKTNDIVEEDIEVSKVFLKEKKTDEQVLFSEEGEDENPGLAFAKKHEDFPGGSDGKMSAYWGRPNFSPWVGKISWRRKWPLTPVFWPGKSHGWRRLVGYSPWGHRVGHDWATSLSETDGSLLRLRKSCSTWNSTSGKSNSVFSPLKSVFLYSPDITVPIRNPGITLGICDGQRNSTGLSLCSASRFRGCWGRSSHFVTSTCLLLVIRPNADSHTVGVLQM